MGGNHEINFIHVFGEAVDDAPHGGGVEEGHGGGQDTAEEVPV